LPFNRIVISVRDFVTSGSSREESTIKMRSITDAHIEVFVVEEKPRRTALFEIGHL